MKVRECPRCNNLVFEGLNQCYECMYVFPKKSQLAALDASAEKRDVTSVSPVRGADKNLASKNLLLASCGDEGVPRTDDVLQDKGAEAAHSYRNVEKDGVRKGRCSLAEAATLIEEGPDYYIEYTDLIGMTQRYQIGPKGLRVGRQKSCDIVIDKPTVSRDHLRIYLDVKRCMVEDRQATNCSYVDGVPLKGCVEIKVGSEIEVQGAKLVLKSFNA